MELISTARTLWQQNQLVELHQQRRIGVREGEDAVGRGDDVRERHPIQRRHDVGRPADVKLVVGRCRPDKPETAVRENDAADGNSICCRRRVGGRGQT